MVGLSLMILHNVMFPPLPRYQIGSLVIFLVTQLKPLVFLLEISGPFTGAFSLLSNQNARAQKVTPSREQTQSRLEHKIKLTDQHEVIEDRFSRKKKGKNKGSSSPRKVSLRLSLDVISVSDSDGLKIFKLYEIFFF